MLVKAKRRPATGNRWVRRVVSSVALVALLSAAAACKASATSGAPSGAEDSSAPTTAPHAPKNSSHGTAPGGTDAQGTATPEALMTTFVTDVLEEHYSEAGLLNDHHEDTRTLINLHLWWAKPGITLPPQSKVTVGKITPNGDTATVTDIDISLDGQTLNDLMLIGSHYAQGFGVSWTLRQQNGKWVISSLDLRN